MLWSLQLWRTSLTATSNVAEWSHTHTHRERETYMHTETQTHTDTDTHTHRHTHKHTHTDIHVHRDTNTYREAYTHSISVSVVFLCRVIWGRARSPKIELLERENYCILQVDAVLATQIDSVRALKGMLNTQENLKRSPPDHSGPRPNRTGNGIEYLIS